MASFGIFDSFFIIKTNQEWGRILHSPWKSKLKLKHMKNPSFGELHSLFQINQACKEENQRSNIHPTISHGYAKFSQSMRNAKRSTSYMTESKPCQTKAKKNEFRTLYQILQTLRKSSCVIFRYFCTDSVRFLSRDILCNYQFSPCNQLKIFLDS